MKAHLKNIFRDTVFYGAIGTSSKLASLLMTPLIVRMFDAAEYGVVDALRVLGLVLSGLSIFAMEQTAARRIAVENDPEQKRIVAGQAFAFSVTAAIVVMGISVVLAHSYATWVFGFATEEVVTSIYYVVLAIPGYVCNAFALMLLRWHFRRGAYALCAVGGVFVLLVTTLFFVVYLECGIEGVFFAQVLSGVFPIAILFVACRRYLSFQVLFNDWSLLGFALPLSTMAQISNLQPMIERLVIMRLIGLDGLGTFSVTQAAARAGKFPADSLYMAWFPYYSKIFREKRVRSLEVTVILGYAMLASCWVLVAHLFSEQIISVFAGQKYIAAAELLGIVLGAFLFEVGASLVGIKVLLAGHAARWAGLYILQSLIFIGLSFLFASDFGLLGIAYAFLCSRVFYFVAATVKSILVTHELALIAGGEKS